MKKLVLIALLGLAAGLQANAQDNTVHTTKGASVKIITKNPGEKIQMNQVVTFDVVQKTEKDSVLFSSYALGHPIKIQVQPSQNVGDLMDVLLLLTAKDSAFVKIPADSVFKGHEDQRPPFMPKGSSLLFTLKIDNVQSLEDAMAEVKNAETAAAIKYIADNKLNVTTTASGLKYIITQPSTKPKPQTGDTVMVNYVGRTLDGKVFDSSIKAEAEKGGLNQPGRNYEPLPVVVNTGTVVKGWDEGLLLMNEGSKAEFIVPSNLGYGSEGSGDIPPYSTMVFELELVKIKPVKHVAKPAPQKAPVKHHTVTKKKS
jgi:FKBP-type peptidyl-prolyl cis-trans isomerase